MPGNALPVVGEVVDFRHYLQSHREEFVALLKKWDEDGDGCISTKEFRQACVHTYCFCGVAAVHFASTHLSLALRVYSAFQAWSVLSLDADLGYEVPKEEVNELYNTMDIDGAQSSTAVPQRVSTHRTFFTQVQETSRWMNFLRQ